MSGEFEAGGAMVTAGLASAAIEGGGEARHEGDGTCINCGAVLAGKFCAACGQPAHIHRTLGHMFEEALHGVLHFDGRMWRTLPKLILRPGTLTHDHIIGRRARYVSPLAAFLFTIFLMFFVFALAGERELAERPANLATMESGLNASAQALAEAEAGFAAARAQLDPAKPLADGVLEGAEKAVADAREDYNDARVDVAEERARIDALRAALAQLDKNEAAAKIKNDEADLAKIGAARQIVEAALADPEGVTPGVEARIAADGGVNVNQTLASVGTERIFEQIREANAEGTLNVNTGIKSLDKKLQAKLENPELAWYKIENTAYKFSFLLLPISLPFLWLMFFWKKGVTLFDHSVFILYSLTFMSLLFIAVALLGRGPDWLSETVLPWMMLAPPVHMFFQLKGAYRLGWFSALWRTGFLLFASLFCLFLFLAAITAVGLLG